MTRVGADARSEKEAAGLAKAGLTGTSGEPIPRIFTVSIVSLYTLPQAVKEEYMAQTFAKQSISASVAQDMVVAAVAEAQKIGVPQVVAVVDESGLLKAFYRMDGAPLVSIEASQNKAYTALFGMPSHEFFDYIKDKPDLLAGVPQLPRIVAIGGGLPIQLDGTVVGAIGVSGGSVEQDIECARAGLRASALEG